MVFTRHAQAAMEFLMTYGWAILVVLIALASLVYFNVLSPKSVLPDQCALFAGMTCSSPFSGFWSPSPPGPPIFHLVKFNVQNGLGYTMQNTTVRLYLPSTTLPTGELGVSFTAPANTKDCTGVVTADPPFAFGIDQLVSCGFVIGTPYTAGSVLKGQIQIQWIDKGGNIRTRTGSIATSVQSTIT
jgi:hypothetical protein